MLRAPQTNKLVLVLANSFLVTGTGTKTSKRKVLDRLSCIRYPSQFRKDKGKDVLALLDSKSEVNVMTLAYAAHLGLKESMTNVCI